MCERLPPHFFDIGHLGVGQTLSVTAGNPDSTAEQQNAVATVFSLSYFNNHQRYIIFKIFPPGKSVQHIH